MSVGIYEKPGVRFFYPEDWSLVDQRWDEETKSVTVQSPNSGFWELHVYDEPTNGEQLVEEFVRAMKSEYGELVECVIASDFAEASSSGVEVVGGYNLSFYCLDMLVCVEVRVVRQGDRTFLIVAQAEDREFEKLGQVFAAISISLFREQPV